MHGARRLRRAEAAEAGFDLAETARQMLGEDRAFRRRGDPPAVSRRQPQAEKRLERADLLGNRRVGDVQFAPGGGIAAAPPPRRREG